MTRRLQLFLLIVSASLCPALLAANRIGVTATISGNRWQISSDASTTLFNSFENIQYSAYIGMRHSLYTTNKTLNAYPRGYGRIQSFLTNTPGTGSTIPAGCNYAEVVGSSLDSAYPAESQSMRTGSHCIQEQAPVTCETEPWRCDPRYFEECPLVLNLGGGPWTLTSVEDGVRFDLNADGVQDHVSWTATDSDLAFVAIDTNGNGMIDDASELVGQRMPLTDGSLPANGFLVLEHHDLNHDALIDSRDPVWPHLLLWTDRNHDGLSQNNEIQSIATGPVLALEVGYRETHRVDRYGNEFRYVSTVHLKNAGRRNYYDIFFSFIPR